MDVDDDELSNIKENGVEIDGMTFVLPAEGLPSGMTVEMMVESLINSGVVKRDEETGRLVHGDHIREDKMIGITCDPEHPENDRQLTDEEVKADMKGFRSS